MRSNKTIQSFIACTLIIAFTLFFIGNNCPVERILGIPCPGCNMFTALYWLILKWNVQVANDYHPMVIPLVIYGVGAFCYFLIKGETFYQSKWFKRMSYAFIAMLMITYVIRMIFVFPDTPMQFNEDALLYKLLRFLNIGV